MDSPEITRYQKEIEVLTQKVSSLSLENANYKHKIKELQETIEQSKNFSMKETKQELCDNHVHQNNTLSSSENSSHSASDSTLNSNYENQVIKQPLLEWNKMNEKIWRVLAQILYYRNDLSNIIKPFFENLHNQNINDENYISVLKTFSKDQLEVLYQNGIITEENFNSLGFITKNQLSTFSVNEDNNTNVEAIISGDKINELQELIQEKDIKTFNTITKSFLEVEKMKITLIQYCIMKKAIECFKYLLVNGFDDPNKTMEEENPYPEGTINYKNWKTQHQYEWDSMATAIYFGNKEIMKILEEKGIKKGKKNSTH